MTGNQQLAFNFVSQNELRRVDMSPCDGDYYISEDGKDIYTTRRNRKSVESVVYKRKTLYKLKERRPYSDYQPYLSIKVLNKRTGKRQQIGVHRMVAYAWLGKPKDLSLEVDHIDGDPQNNHANNLRWCTHAENLEFARNRKQWAGKPVECWDTGEIFRSASEAFEKYKKPGQKSKSGLLDCLKGRTNSWHGFCFRYIGGE